MTLGRIRLLAVCAVAAVAACAWGQARSKQQQQQEVSLSNEELKKLEVFEGHVLSKADKAFAERQYVSAAAEYDSFILEFPKSKAVAYAFLRKARSMHLQQKRYQAVKEYQEVLDYFPDAVKYAAAALYYQGLCHWENGEVDKAMQSWAALADDEDYRRHVLAANAINQLADHLVKQGKADKAVEYYQQVAADFRVENPAAAVHAIEKAAAYFVRTASDEKRLRAFYEKVRTFQKRPEAPKAGAAGERAYWQQVRQLVKDHGGFPAEQAELADRYWRYWAGVMEGKFADWDDFQIDLAAFKLKYEKDLSKWFQRLDEQFTRQQRQEDYGRVIRWIALYGRHKGKVEEYYAKLDFARMTQAQVQELMRVLYDGVRDAAMAANAFRKLRLGEMPDAQKVQLARYLWEKDGALVKEVCMSMSDKDLGKAELLRYYHQQRDARNGLPLAEDLANAPKYADEAVWKKAELLDWSRKYQEAIAAYLQADKPPENLWRIADCYVKMGKLQQAVEQLREVEGFFKEYAAAAALKIAHVYRQAGNREQYVASLRAVLKKYPKSAQSSAAHQELEKLGVRIGGGVDAE